MDESDAPFQGSQEQSTGAVSNETSTASALPARTRPYKRRARCVCTICHIRKVRCDLATRGNPCSNCFADQMECVQRERPPRRRISGLAGVPNSTEQPQTLTSPHNTTFDHNWKTEPPNALGSQWTNSEIGQHQSLARINEPGANHANAVNNRGYVAGDFQNSTMPISSPTGMPFPSPMASETWSNEQLAALLSMRQTYNEDAMIVDDLLVTLQNGYEPFNPGGALPSNPSIMSAAMPDPAQNLAYRGFHMNENIQPALPSLDPFGAQQDMQSPSSGSATSMDQNRPTYSGHFYTGNTSHKSSQDIKYLTEKGCFWLPAKHDLIQILEQYFRYVHPNLPIVHEGDMWELLSSLNEGESPYLEFPPLVLRAMLFASSGYVPQNLLTKFGFLDSRHARSELYAQAKLIFDFDLEQDPFTVAQGALLLSYHSPSVNPRKASTYWLTCAISFARSVDAHRWYHLDLPEKELNRLKRLWWCCVFRDRILPLGVRRPLQITYKHYNFDSDTGLKEEDFKDEIGRSRVYDRATKATMVKVWTATSKLARILTRVIMTIYPLDEVQEMTILSDQDFAVNVSEIDKCFQGLSEWFNETTIHLPMPAGLDESHESTVLFTNLLYIYYHSAIVGLCHHGIRVWESQTNRRDRPYWDNLRKTRRHLVHSVEEITSSTKELVQMKQSKYMPISAVAYLATPLLLHVLDVKQANTSSGVALRKRRLGIYLEAMKQYTPLYEGSDFVSDMIQRLSRYVDTDSTLSQSLSPPKDTTGSPPELRETAQSREEDSSPEREMKPGSWSNTLLQNPLGYLRLTYFLDISFTTMRAPRELDFPKSLRQNGRDI